MPQRQDARVRAMADVRRKRSEAGQGDGCRSGKRKNARQDGSRDRHGRGNVEAGRVHSGIRPALFRGQDDSQDHCRQRQGCQYRRELIKKKKS